MFTRRHSIDLLESKERNGQIHGSTPMLANISQNSINIDEKAEKKPKVKRWKKVINAFHFVKPNLAKQNRENRGRRASDGDILSKVKAKLPSGGLFHSVDEDDLFGSISTGPKSADSKARSGSLFVEDGEDDLFSGTSKTTESKKKPVGGVALFGGGDLFAEAKNKVEKREEAALNKESEKSTAPIKPPRKNTLSLFDDDNDNDSSDLFGAVAPTPTQPSKTEPSKTAAKPQSKSRSTSLFDDEDVLFGTTEENPSVDLFGAQSPLTPTQPENKQFPKVEAESPPKSETKKDPAAQQGMTVSGATTTASSTDDGQDLILATKKATPPKIPPRKSEIMKISGTTTTESSPDLFGDSPEGDLFTSKPKETLEAARPKKLAGAVSMFGGMDPSALKKKQTSSAADPLDTQDGGGHSKPRTASGSSFDGPTPFGASSHQTTRSVKGPGGFKSVSPPKPKADVGRLQTNPRTNRSTFPNSSPSRKEPEPVATSFDQPAEVKTLQTVSKDRARIVNKRRPQSRKNRQSAVLSSGIDFTDSSSSEVTPTSPSDSFPATNHIGASSGSSPNKAGADLFRNSDSKNVRSNRLSSKETDASKDRPFNSITYLNKNMKNNNNNDDIVNSSKSETRTGLENNLVGGEATKGGKEVDDIFSKKQSPPKLSADDIFANIGKAKTEERTSQPTNKEDTSVNTKDNLLTAKGAKSKVLLPEEDDIFADASISVKKTTTPNEDVFSPRKDLKQITKTASLEDDDIFASSSKPEKRRPKKAVSKDEDLFTDNTDIFADLPPSRPKKKKVPTAALR